MRGYFFVADFIVAMPLTEATRYQLSRNTQEACGVTGIFGKAGQDIAPLIPVYQDRITNRGRDAAGIAVFKKDSPALRIYKGPGRASSVFADVDFQAVGLEGSVGIGHNRYATSGEEDKDSPAGMQPVEAEYNGRSIAIAYNGNLPDALRARLQAKIPEDMPKAPANIDTYDISRAIISASGEEWEEKFRNALGDIPLAYSLTMLTDDGRLFGLRCPTGTWPLWFTEVNNTVVFASESRVVQSTEAIWQSVKPGELVEATPDGVRRKQLFEPWERRCALNDLYGARQDSLIFPGVTYREFREEIGRKLAEEHPIDADIVIGVPETGLAMADGYASFIGKEATQYIAKKKGAGPDAVDDNGSQKSFIAADEASRMSMIDSKFLIPNPDLGDVSQLARGKAVVVDDSMIRGSTMAGDPRVGAKGIINRLRENGVGEVHLMLAAPKFVEGCDQGYYIKRDQLIAIIKADDGTYIELDEKEIADTIGADSVGYLSINGLKDVYEHFTGERDCACMACMGEPHPLDSLQHSDIKPITLYDRNQIPVSAEIDTVFNRTAAD